jgi:hypothetical protein
LHADNGHGVARIALGSRFADANDRREPCAQRRLGLGVNDFIAL